MPPQPDHETATFVRAQADRIAPLGALIRVVGLPGKPASFRLVSGKCVLGSAAGCHVTIPERTVSRAHVELELVPEGVRVRDLGSRNGTFYLGQRIEVATLSLGARIKLGAVEVNLDADVDSLKAPLLYAESAYRGMVGASPAMRRLFAVLQRLEGSLVTVLVEGESGVGKELVARAIHEGSQVASGPLVVLNCGAVARDLIQSELFGHKKGAFTGAIDGRKGAFESADGGTLMLDEVGELPLELQPMLLRALEGGEIRPVGAEQTKTVKVRLVAATNRDLAEEVRGGRFREDLFYRLAVVKIEVPPLRDRPEDVEPIAQRFAHAAGTPPLPPGVIEELKLRRWPGNVRELRNAVQAFAALGYVADAAGAGAAPLTETPDLDAVLEAFLSVDRPYAEQKEQLADRFTRLYLKALMAHAGGNQTAAAQTAGLERSYLGRLLVKHGIRRPT